MARQQDGTPRPADPVWYRRGDWLRVACRCGHAADLPIGPVASRHGVPPEARLRRMVERLRCRRCGERPAHVEVEERRR